MSVSRLSDTAVISRELPIVNQRGLHARASAKFVQVAAGFQADISVEKDGVKVGGTSIMGLMMLGAAMGDTITISAAGDEAEDVVAKMCELVEAKFGEE